MDSIESVVARIDERTKGMDANLSAILDRLKWVESVASDVKEFPEFRKMVTDKIEGYNEVCHQVENFPSRFEKIETDVSNLGGRVEVLERTDIKTSAQQDMISKIWDILNKPLTGYVLLAAFMLYLHLVAGGS